MKLLRTADRADKLSKAKQITYENVKIVGGYGNFVDALQKSKLVSDSWKGVVSNGKWTWDDQRHRDGVLVETADNPMIYRTNFTFSGSHEALLRVKSVMERYAEYDGKPEAQDITFQYHDTLNDEIWDQTEDGFQMRPEVQQKLMEIADQFYEFLKIEGVDVEDVVLTGSSANFNWTENSDVDLHLVIDKSKLKKLCGELVDEYLDAKKRIWNDLHEIKIRSFPVELYVEGSDEPAVSAGVYSIQDGKWISEPKHEEPTIDSSAVKAKVNEYVSEIQDVLSANKAAAVERLIERLRKMRQSGLDEGGEMSVENVAYKELRNQGWLEKLYDCKSKAYDRSLSIEDEEWSHYR